MHLAKFAWVYYAVYKLLENVVWFMPVSINALLRKIPKVDEVLAGLGDFSASPVLTDAVRVVLDELRGGIQGGDVVEIPEVEALAREALRRFESARVPNLKRVVNGTGIILHTNLGRAPLAAEALGAIAEVSRDYSNLEYDIDEGKRSSRYVHVEKLLTQLTGAEAAMVVNNNAAAVMLTLAGVKTSRKVRCPHPPTYLNQVLVSRGELVEIGGSFRIPDVMQQSGCKLVEVGTTNKTHLTDYERAIHPEKTAALLRVHTSNFAIIGFTAKPSLEELAELAHAHDIPLIEDLGSGCLLPIHNQPTVAASVKAGVDIVTFSGDKLLGGPQAGIIVGKAHLISKMKSHPLTRAFRIDKLCLAALEATLKLYQDPSTAIQKIPTLRMLSTPDLVFLTKVEELRELLNKHAIVSVVETQSQAGGGAMPEENLKSFAVSIEVPNISAVALERHFRINPLPIIGRIADDKFLLDVRTLNKEDFPLIAKRLEEMNKNDD